MSITLTVGTTVLALDPDLLWEDEFAWAATEQTMTRGLTGKPIIQYALRQAGRPITLRNEDDRSAWMTRADMAQLQTWADTPGQRITLALRGASHLVVFRHHDGGPFEARPLVHYADPLPADWVLATLRFVTVTE
ncbi:MAG: hypothetical protein ROZ37_01600 [Aromatoleum sp.]|jgi:hypothetical protein|uniref:hypothetical protein n=1 Tax=Aromatoleum sp. TaxID=2307007 RepID=UPI0028944AD8|nr:hypothetical protein [Aromatoleum sp.]MDT3669009.1 hypothetical protein [Aromatoleum sp.]